MLDLAFKPPALERMWFSSVVLPAPRKPESTVTRGFFRPLPTTPVQAHSRTNFCDHNSSSGFRTGFSAHSGKLHIGNSVWRLQKGLAPLRAGPLTFSPHRSCRCPILAGLYISLL